MPQSSKSSSTVQASRKALQLKNAGDIVMFYNPAPFIPNSALLHAKESGAPVEIHRDNTPWYLTVPSLNVTIKMVENDTPLTGWQNFDVMLVLADSIITQLKSLKPDELRKYQQEVPEWAGWSPELRKGGRFKAMELPATA